jgi:hypothetical protein
MRNCIQRFQELLSILSMKLQNVEANVFKKHNILNFLLIAQKDLLKM